ncbi:MAG: hypothetical protein R6V49_03470, partial [Bacteroidales bacterium]
LLSQNPRALKQVVIELRDDNHFPPHHANTLRKRYFMSPRWYAFIVKSAIGSPIPAAERKNSIRRYGLALLERLCNIDYFNSIYAPDEETVLKNEERTYNIRNRSVQGFLPVLYNREEEVREAFLRDTTRLGSVAARLRSLKKAGEPRSVNKNHVEFIHRMISRCNDEGIHIVFFLHPKLDPMYLEGTIALSHYIPENHLIDISDPESHPELYLVKNSLNNNHFNSRGTQILSNLAARKFMEVHQGWLQAQATVR